MIWVRPAWGGGGGGGCIPLGPGGAGGAGAPGTLRASLSGCSGPLGSASWLMAAASTLRNETGPGSRRESAREGRPRGAGAHWPGSPCPVPLSFPVARGGDARGGEEAVPAAPPPPPPPPPAGPARSAGPNRGRGQGASPSQQEPLGAQVVGGALSAARRRAPSGSPVRRPAAQCNRVRRRDARQSAAGRRVLASPASGAASGLSPGTARAASRAPAKRGGPSAPRASALFASAKCAGLGTFPRLEPGQRHWWLRGPTPRGRSPEFPQVAGTGNPRS